LRRSKPLPDLEQQALRSVLREIEHELESLFGAVVGVGYFSQLSAAGKVEE